MTTLDRIKEIKEILKHISSFGASYRTDMEWLISTLEQELRLSQGLREAMKSLRNESKGFLSMANPHDHGHTNIECLRNRINQAEEALAAYEQGRKK
jgi:hypothetical protein